jgi:hypothetical protein
LLTEEAKLFASASEYPQILLAWEPSVISRLAAKYAKRPDEGLRSIVVNAETRIRDAVTSAIEAGLLVAGSGAILRPDPHDVQGGRLDLRVVPSSRPSIASWFQGATTAAKPISPTNVAEISSAPTATEAQEASKNPQALRASSSTSDTGRSQIDEAINWMSGLANSFTDGFNPVQHSASLPSPLQSVFEETHQAEQDMHTDFMQELEFAHIEWSWDSAWLQLWEFVYKWHAVIAVAILVFGITSAVVPAAAAAVAPAIQVMQTTAAVAAFTVPVATAAFVWYQRDRLFVLILVILVGPVLLQVTRFWRWCRAPAVHQGHMRQRHNLGAQQQQHMAFRRSAAPVEPVVGANSGRALQGGHFFDPSATGERSRRAVKGYFS